MIPKTMISVAAARALLLEHPGVLKTESVPLASALGRTLAAPIIATRDQPPFAASAMDGYGVRSADTPAKLRVIGQSAAGNGFIGKIGRGEAVRIFTGAPLPDGADAVVIQEEAAREGGLITAPKTLAGRFVRPAGVDFANGATLLEAGRTLDGVALALAAAAGRADIEVARRPQIAILAGGEEIVAPGVSPNSAQIFDSASFGVAGLAQAWGGDAAPSPPLPDTLEAIARAAQHALETADLVVIIGGASVGDRDLARAALQNLGAEIVFSTVAVRPGKPTWFARCNGVSVLGLPGNPASALVCARLFLRPMLERMLGQDGNAASLTRAARLAQPLGANDQRESYLRAVSSADENGQLWVEGFPEQDSSLLRVFAASNCLVQRAPHAAPAGVGEIVQILPI